MNNEQQFVNILEKFSDKSWDLPLGNFELSGWSENPTFFDLNKTILSEHQSSLSKYTNNDRRLNTSHKGTHQKSRIPLISKTPSRKSEQLEKKSNFKTNLLKGNRYLTKRFENSCQSVDSSYTLQITTIPLLKSDRRRKNKSLSTEKRPLKLEEYYDRSFLIVQRSPPTVSGYSVTFYHK